MRLKFRKSFEVLDLEELGEKEELVEMLLLDMSTFYFYSLWAGFSSDFS